VVKEGPQLLQIVKADHLAGGDMLGLTPPDRLGSGLISTFPPDAHNE